MVYRDDPSGRQELADLKRRIAALETQSPLRSSSITDGRLRIGGSAILLIDSSGGIVVEGRLTGNGTLEWTKTVNLTGTTTITGPTTITGDLTAKGTTRFEGDTTQVGPFHVTGPTDVTGNFTARGTTRLEGDTTQVGPSHIQGNQDITGNQTINSPGKITVAGAIPMVLGDAKLKFSSGGTLKGYSGGVVLQADESSGAAVQVSGSEIALVGTVRIAGLPTKSGVAANLYADANGTLFRII